MVAEDKAGAERVEELTSELRPLIEGLQGEQPDAVVDVLGKLRRQLQAGQDGNVAAAQVFFEVVGNPQTEGNPLFDAWDRHGAEKAASRVVVHVVDTTTALMRTCRTAAAAAAAEAQSASPWIRGVSGPARALGRTLLQTKAGAILAVLGSRGSDRAVVGMLSLLTEVAQLGAALAREILTQVCKPAPRVYGVLPHPELFFRAQVEWGSRALLALAQRRADKAGLGKKRKSSEGKQTSVLNTEDAMEAAAAAEVTQPIRSAYLRLGLAILDSGKAGTIATHTLFTRHHESCAGLCLY